MPLLKREFEEPKKDAVDKSKEREDLLKPGFEKPKEDITSKQPLTPSYDGEKRRDEDLTPAEKLLKPSYEEEKKDSLETAPLRFRPSRQIITFDYFDIANGVGYDVFYGFSMAGTTGTATEKIYSGMIHKAGSTVALNTPNTYFEMLDFDFDIIFNNPKNIKQDILAQIPFGLKNTGASGAVITIKATVSVYHYGGSETQLGSTVTSEEVSKSMASNDLNSHISTLKVNLSSIQHFKKGEILRFTIKVYAKTDKTSGDRNAVGAVGCDPMNRTDTGDIGSQIIETDEPTRMEFHVPFVLDI